MDLDLIPLVLWMGEGASSLLAAGLAACATCGYLLSENMGLGGMALGAGMIGAVIGSHWNPRHYIPPNPPERGPRQPPSVSRKWTPPDRTAPIIIAPPSGVPYEEWRQEWDQYFEQEKEWKNWWNEHGDDIAWPPKVYLDQFGYPHLERAYPHPFAETLTNPS